MRSEQSARFRALLIWIGATAIGPSGHASEPELTRFEFRHPHMGTEFRIILYAPHASAARAASHAAFERIAQLDAALSDYRPDSELMRLCAQAGGPAVPVSRDLFLLLDRSQQLSRRSCGAFDVTVGPVVRLWRRARRMHQMPDPDRLARARALVGYEKVRLDERSRSVQLSMPGMQLDLGGIAKGYAVDQALERLTQHGITRALVAGGGDIAVSGAPPLDAGWTIGVADLEPAGPKPGLFLSLRDSAISTSGDTEQYAELEGKRYSHIVDPRTGLGVVGRMSVTVVAGAGTTADGLATAVSVLGPARGLDLVESTDGAAALIVWQTERGLETIESRRFQAIPRAGPRSRSPASPERAPRQAGQGGARG